jgi:tetratricopeptide (TPR) repeat protein
MSGNENDDLESARILIQENLLDESKRILFRMLTRISDTNSISYRRAREMLSQIEKIELDELMNKAPRGKRTPRVEDPTRLIHSLEKDLSMEPIDSEMPIMEVEQWSVVGERLPARELLDLAVAFFEMGCYGDAIRELKKAEKRIRIEETFLGELGVSIVALQAQALIELGQPFDARIYLEPILLESDIPHEQKIILYYSMGLAEQALENKISAKAWLQKVKDTEPNFKDVEQRLRHLNHSS